jgi:hypothetical protein
MRFDLGRYGGLHQGWGHRPGTAAGTVSPMTSVIKDSYAACGTEEDENQKSNTENTERMAG